MLNFNIGSLKLRFTIRDVDSFRESKRFLRQIGRSFRKGKLIITVDDIENQND